MQKLFKGFTVSLIFIISMMFLVNVKASTAYFVWEKTVIDVPVYSSLEEYKDDYVVKLYVDGVLSSDFEVDYEVNTSTFSTVLTNRVGRYTVYYKAYSKNNYVSSVQAIIFNVYDDTPPTVNLQNNLIEVEIGEKIESSGWFTATDDTCKYSDLKITIDDSDVIYNAAGTYTCTLYVSDLYGNESKTFFKVKIVDKTKPLISIIKPLIFLYGEDVDINEYLEYSDNSSLDIGNMIEVEGLDTSKVGKIELIVKVYDYYGNETKVIMEGIVVDKVPPIISLIKNEVTLDIEEFEAYNEDFFKEYIYSVSDNYSKKKDIDIKIDLTNLKPSISDFVVYYIATDENNNKTKRGLTVKIRETIGPEINGEDVVRLDVGSDVNLSDYVTLYDKYDPNVLERLMIESDDFTTDKAGIYYVKYISFNTSGIYSEKTIKFIVGNPSSASKSSKDNDFVIYLAIVGGLMVLGGGYLTFKYIQKRRKIKH